jgi:hypothetical protein
MMIMMVVVDGADRKEGDQLFSFILNYFSFSSLLLFYPHD